MTYATVNSHVRMAYWLSRRISTVVAARTIIHDDAVIDIGILEIVSRVAGTTVTTEWYR